MYIGAWGGGWGVVFSVAGCFGQGSKHFEPQNKASVQTCRLKVLELLGSHTTTSQSPRDALLQDDAALPATCRSP